MEPYLRKTVELIDSEIKIRQDELDQLTTTRKSLVELGGGQEPDNAEAGKADRQVRPTKKERAARQPARSAAASAPVATAPGSGRQPTAESVKLLSIVRTAPEPFTAASLAVASGFETKFCANRLNRWLTNKLLEKGGRGEFKRAANFPEEAPEE